MIGVLRTERPHDLTVDEPVELCGAPVDRVRVKRRLGIGQRHEHPAIVVARDALGEVVVLHHAAGVLGGQVEVVPRHLPVDLVEAVGHEHTRRDHANAWGHLHLYVHAAEEDVEVREQLRSVVPLVEGEFGAVLALRIVRDRGEVGDAPLVIQGLRGVGEVYEIRPLVEPRVWVAGLWR